LRVLGILAATVLVVCSTVARAAGDAPASATVAVPEAPPAAEELPTPPAARDLAGCYPSAEPGRVACFDRPSAFGFLLDVPRDIGGLARDAVRVENLPWTLGIAAATAGLMVYDQRLADGAHRVGRWAHISSNGDTAKVAPWLPIPYPTDVGSGIYYLGDGMLPVSITVGMLGYGLWTQDTRVLRTTSHLAEGLVSVAIVAQTIKHVSGRQSPSRSTEDGGRWRPLPNPLDYQKNVPAFDAFPSGHVATAMVTVTVLAEDYPEYWLIRPVGYGMMALLGFQMMNNDVHWASDYPLAIAVGYGLGKHAVTRGRSLVDAPEASEASRRKAATTVELVPFPVGGGGGLAVAGTFF
jgi:hypothetical protein